jgi:hypothetical protein
MHGPCQWCWEWRLGSNESCLQVVASCRKSIDGLSSSLHEQMRQLRLERQHIPLSPQTQVWDPSVLSFSCLNLRVEYIPISL